MKKILLIVAALAMVMGIAGEGMAGVNVNVGIDLPPLQFRTAPDVVVVPSGDADIYMVPGTPGLYFYGGYWYRVNEDRWFRSRAYNGRWVYVRPEIVPGVVVDISPEYSLYLPPDYMRIRFGDFRRHWRSWDRDRHWNRYDWYRNERREDIRRERMSHMERERGAGGMRHDRLRHEDRRPEMGHDRVRREDRRPEMNRDRRLQAQPREQERERRKPEPDRNRNDRGGSKDYNKMIHPDKGDR